MGKFLKKLGAAASTVVAVASSASGHTANKIVNDFAKASHNASRAAVTRTINREAWSRRGGKKGQG